MTEKGKVQPVRMQDIKAICRRCAAGKLVERFEGHSRSGIFAWSHSPSWLDECPAGPIWELTRKASR